MPATQQVTPLRKTRTPATKAPIQPVFADLARLTIKEVQALTGRSESSLRDMIRAGRFPQPDYRDGPRCVRWNAGTVRNWLQATTSPN